MTSADDDASYMLWANDKKMWWQAGGFGYTAEPLEAGLFSAAQATKEALRSAQEGNLDCATVIVRSDVLQPGVSRETSPADITDALQLWAVDTTPIREANLETRYAPSGIELPGWLRDAMARKAERLVTEAACTHGDGCPVHPNVHTLHNFDRGEYPPAWLKPIDMDGPPLSVKVYYVRLGGHTHVHVWTSSGGPDTTHGKVGTLVFPNREWHDVHRLLQVLADAWVTNLPDVDGPALPHGINLSILERVA